MSDQELNVHMQQLSSSHSNEFDNMAALKELYIYINKYFTDIMDSLDESPQARKLGLGHKLKSLAMSVYPQQNICWNWFCKNFFFKAFCKSLGKFADYYFKILYIWYDVGLNVCCLNKI